MTDYKKILQGIISIFLVGIFALSITPVIVLHNLFADHTDIVIVHHHTKSNEVAKAGIDCHIENFVAERNFLTCYNQIDFNHYHTFSVLSYNYNEAFYCQHHFYAELRGPPVKA